MAGALESLYLSGFVATARALTFAYINKDDLAVALEGLEGKIAGMITPIAQGGNK